LGSPSLLNLVIITVQYSILLTEDTKTWEEGGGGKATSGPRGPFYIPLYLPVKAIIVNPPPLPG